MTLTPRRRPEVTRGNTYRVATGCGNIYITINEDDEGICEVFASVGKSGGCATSQTEAIGRLLSYALRAGADPADLVEQLKNIACPSPTVKGPKSCADAIALVLGRYVKEGAARTDAAPA